MAMTPEAGAPRFEQFFAVRRFQGLDPLLAFTPDGRRVLFVTDGCGQFNLWSVSVTGGRLRQLTAFEDHAVRDVAVSPDGRIVVFTADYQGDEQAQIYSMPSHGGWPEAWTNSPATQHHLGPSGWSPDGRWLAFAANARVPTDMDVWIREIATGEVRKVFGGNKTSYPASWSPDCHRLLVVDRRSSIDSSLYLVDVTSGVASEVTPHQGEAKFVPGPWARDGSGFYLLSDEGREYMGMAFYHLANGSYRWVETPEQDVEEIAGSADGQYLAWLVNDGGWSRLHIRNLETGQLMPTPRLPAGCGWHFGTGLALAPDGQYAALIWHRPRRTAEIYAVHTTSGKATRATDSVLGGLREDHLLAPQPIDYPTFDGRQVNAWLYRPPGPGRHPVVLSIHGGPELQERPFYQPLYQYLLSRGIAVLAPNVRGSRGYGKTYQKSIHRDWGGGELADLEQAVRWLHRQDWVASDRIGVIGESFGGFAALSCLTRLPHYWAAGVDICGPSNLITLASSVPPTWKRAMAQWIGDPETEADFLRQRSPITYVENMRAPVLIIQGARDPRVAKAESDQIVEKLRSHGREVEYVIFEDEGHGFTKRSNQVKAFRLAAQWLERHLL